MDKIYEKESKKLLITLRNYINDGASLNDLKLQARRTDIAYNLKDSKSFIKEHREYIFNFYNNQYKMALDLDRKVRERRKKKDLINIDVDIDVLMEQAYLIGKASRAPPFDNLKSDSFLPPFPTQQMMRIEENVEEEKKIVEEKEEETQKSFTFEF
jgi:hypothetical protein